MSGDIWEGGNDVTTRPYPSLWGGGDLGPATFADFTSGFLNPNYLNTNTNTNKDNVQISMKNCHTKGSDSALESLSLTKIVSIKCSGVGGDLGRGELTSLPGHILVCGIWGREGCMTFGSDFNKKMRKNFKR